MKKTLNYRPHDLQLWCYRNRKRFNVLVCHRRWGKSIYQINRMIKGALEGINKRKNKQCSDYQGAYIAPLKTQVKKVAWDEFKHFLSNVPGMKYNETELKILFPNGAKIYLLGADNPDSLKGMYLDDATMDEVAQMSPDIWDEVIRPQLADRKGTVDFIGTPKGVNQFHEIYQRAMNDKSGDWFSAKFSIYDSLANEDYIKTTGITPEEIEDARQMTAPNKFRQEYLCDFQASSSDAVIPIDLVIPARKRHLTEDQYMFAEKVMGIDVGRDVDASVITRRQGKVVFPQRVLHIPDNMVVAGIISQEIESFNPDCINVDKGAGVGVIDKLREMGYSINEIPFNGTPDDGRKYFNKRAEMYGRAKDWLAEGGAIPDEPDLQQELCAVETVPHKHDTLKLEDKDDIKKRLGGNKSPDKADSFVLTFARNLRINHLPQYVRTDKRTKYHPHDRLRRR